MKRVFSDISSCSMRKMLRLSICIPLFWFITGSTFSLPCRHHGHHGHHEHTLHTRDFLPGLPEIFPEYDYGEDYDSGQQGPFLNNGCSCRLFAERELVYQFEDTSMWYSCTPWGLYRCGQYCDGLLDDTENRNRTRQNACDTIGREINTPWYRRHQVCGEYGPHEDYQMREDLCCRRGRPSDDCEED